MKRFLMGTVTLISILSFNTASAVTIDLVNDFEDGTTMGWSKGFNSSPRRDRQKLSRKPMATIIYKRVQLAEKAVTAR